MRYTKLTSACSWILISKAYLPTLVQFATMQSSRKVWSACRHYYFLTIALPCRSESGNTSRSPLWLRFLSASPHTVNRRIDRHGDQAVTARLPAKSLRDAVPVGFHDTHRLWKTGKSSHARAIPSETERAANGPYDLSQSFKTGFWSVLGGPLYFITVRTEMCPRGCQVRDMRLLRNCQELNSV